MPRRGAQGFDRSDKLQFVEIVARLRQPEHDKQKCVGTHQMTRVKVKICGDRTTEEALASIEAGADALGFNFWPHSARYVTAKSASEVIKNISPISCKVGV